MLSHHPLFVCALDGVPHTCVIEAHGVATHLHEQYTHAAVHTHTHVHTRSLECYMREADDAAVAEYIAKDLMHEVLGSAEGWKLKRVLEEVCVVSC
jgi:hypothetical protein